MGEPTHSPISNYLVSTTIIVSKHNVVNITLSIIYTTVTIPRITLKSLNTLSNITYIFKVNIKRRNKSYGIKEGGNEVPD